jgi:hypothetical protein
MFEAGSDFRLQEEPALPPVIADQAVLEPLQSNNPVKLGVDGREYFA